MKPITRIYGLLLLLPMAAFAAPPDELRYNFIDIGLAAGEVESFGEDFDFGAAGVTGSWGVHKNFALFGRLGATVIDSGSNFVDDPEASEASLGINPHFALSKKVDLVIPLAVEWVDVDYGPFSDDDVGYSIGLGIRALLSPSWELSVGVQHIDIFNDDDQSIAGSVRWHIGDLFSLSLGATASEDATAVAFGGRFTF
jgi:hypothetical protein